MGFLAQPQFHMPFRCRLNPHVDRARLHAGEWAGRMGMFDEEYLAWPGRWSEETFSRADFPLFIALTHPNADADELDLVTAWHVALWFVDDLFLPTVADRLDIQPRSALRSSSPPRSPTRSPRPATPVLRVPKMSTAYGPYASTSTRFPCPGGCAPDR